MVGVLAYFPSEADALANTNMIGSSGYYTVGQGGPYGGYTYWRIASNSTGSSSQTGVYPNGAVLNSPGAYKLYPAAPCFLEGTQILCQKDGVEKYLPIESLRSGDFVKTSRDGYKKIELIGKGVIKNPGSDERIENRLYKCTSANFPEIREDLYITGAHSILVDTLTDEEREQTIKQLGKIFVTDKKYRLIASIDKRAEPWNSEGEYRIWHFALENVEEGWNYGVYANGLLVETCPIVFLKKNVNMAIV